MTESTPRPTPVQLRRMRRLADISQAALARQLGVSRPRVAQLEARAKCPPGAADRYLRALVALQAEGRARNE